MNKMYRPTELFVVEAPMWKSCSVASFVFFSSLLPKWPLTVEEEAVISPQQQSNWLYSLIALRGKMRESVQCPDLPTTGTHQRIPERRVCVSLLPHSGRVARSALFHISCQISTFYRFYLTGLSGAETLLVCSVTAYNSQMNKNSVIMR